MKDLVKFSSLKLLLTLCLSPLIVTFVDSIINRLLGRCEPLILEHYTKQFCNMITGALYPDFLPNNISFIIRRLVYAIFAYLIASVVVIRFTPYMKRLHFIRIKKVVFINLGFFIIVIILIFGTYIQVLTFLPIGPINSLVVNTLSDSMMVGAYPRAINPTKDTALIIDSYAQSEKWNKISEKSTYSSAKDYVTEYYYIFKYLSDQSPDDLKYKLLGLLINQVALFRHQAPALLRSLP